MQHRLTRRWETSIYRTDKCLSGAVWTLCSEHVDDHAKPRIMKALGTCTAALILDQQLRFDADGRPHPRHANIIDWPESKHAQKIIQQKIAGNMTLELRP